MTQLPTTNPLEIFISYCHKDENLKNELVNFLKIIGESWNIDIWHDRGTFAGDLLLNAIGQKLNSANIILLLISADYLNSPSCKNEISIALKRHQSGRARVIPVILRPLPAIWKDLPFGELNALPTYGKPVIKWDPRDDAFVDIADGVNNVLGEYYSTYRSTGIQVEYTETLTITTVADQVVNYSTASQGASIIDAPDIQQDNPCDTVPVSPQQAEGYYAPCIKNREGFFDSILATEAPRIKGFYTSTDVNIWQATREYEPQVKTIIISEKGKNDSGNAGDKNISPAINAVRGVVERNVNAILVGRAGSGKTTTLRRFLIEEITVAKRNPKIKIPIFIELKYYGDSIKELIRGFFLKHGERPSHNDIERLIHEGNILLLFDGLNELPTRNAILDLEDFRNRYEKYVPMIFSTRDTDTGGGIAVDTRLEMLPMSNEQLKDYIMERNKEKGKEMLRRLRERHYELGRNPMFLDMLSTVYERIGTLPGGLGRVFRDFTLHYEKDIKPTDVVLDLCHKSVLTEILQKIAFEMMTGDESLELRTAIGWSDVFEIITGFLKNKGFSNPVESADTILDYLTNYHYLQSGHGGKIEFVHQLIQEYYAAEYLAQTVKSINDQTLKNNYLNYNKWTESLVMMMNLLDNRDQALRIVRLALDVEPRLAAKLAGAADTKFHDDTIKIIGDYKAPDKVKILLFRETASESAIENLAEYLSDKYDDSIRPRAAFALGNIHSDNAAKILKNILDSENAPPKLKRRAAFALFNITSEEQYKIIVQWYDQEAKKKKAEDQKAPEKTTPCRERYSAAQLFTELKSPISWQRGSAATALGQIRDTEAVPALIDRLLKDKDSIVRGSAATALGQIRDTAAVPALIEALKGNENYSDVRGSAATALGQIRDTAAVPALINCLLKDKDNINRGSAATALGQIRDTAAVPALMKCFLEDKKHNVRGSAAAALGQIQEITVVYKYVTESLYDMNSDNIVLSNILMNIQLQIKLYNPLLSSGDGEDTAPPQMEYSAGKLKILFLSANPEGSNKDTLRLDKEIREITDKIRMSEYRDSLEFKTRSAVRPDDLLQILNEEMPHILHFSGHGDEGGLLFLNEKNGEGKFVDLTSFVNMLETMKDNLRGVVLNACYSGTIADSITNIVDFAVGMNDEVGDEAAIVFAASFYRAIGFGKPLKNAFDQGKTALMLNGIPEENIPELFLKDGIESDNYMLLQQ